VTDVAPRPLASFPLAGEDWGGVVRYGPLVDDERTLRLLPTVAGRRVLLLGAGAGQAATVLAGGGARVIAVDPSAPAVQATLQRCAADGRSADVRHCGLSELAFVRAETIDLALSVFALSEVADLTRVFRQVHRVLRPDAPIVLSLPHPVLSVLDDGRAGGGWRGVYGESAPTPWSADGVSGTDHHHTTEAVTTALSRAAFALDVLSEPRGRRPARPDPWWRPALAHLPAVLIVRARKVGL
jgi:SAM-dependent methyltransferase